jgi:hypothetical protein
MSTTSDILFYIMVGLMPSMIALGLLLRQNPFDQNLIVFHESDDHTTVDSLADRSQGTDA